MKFALIGAAGYVAPRHMKAIKETGNELVAAADTWDSVGILDTYFPDCQFFTNIHGFWDWLKENPVDYVSICTPNNCHYLHCINAMGRGANVICEKPLTTTAHLADTLAAMEKQTNKKINVILQLRISPMMLEIKKEIKSCQQFDVTMRYITPRGPWYYESWKGDKNRSGGILMNIGIHLFDILIWLFGSVKDYSVEMKSDTKAKGGLLLDTANVNWFLSLDRKDLPDNSNTHRLLTIGGKEYRFDKVFADLHTRAYSQILEGRGFGPLDALPSIALVEKLSKFSQTSQLK